jgi:hypothetical protein
MTLELVNANTSLSRKYSRQFWGKALELARSYGWRPSGTQPPVIPGFHSLKILWDGTYLTNDGQTVAAADARSLADALARALDHIPDTGAAPQWNPRLWIEDELPEWLSPEEREIIEDGLEAFAPDARAMRPLDFFAGDEKQYLIGLIRFCRLGSFLIL